MTFLDQIQNAIDFIETHLHDNLSLDEIAKQANFSRWHFQMVFNSAVGETVKDYIRKRRLSESLEDLKTDKRIIDIALRAGFESQEAYTRAFKNLFAITPGDYRKTGSKTHSIFSKPKITMGYLDHLYKGFNMQPVFITCEEFIVIGLGSPMISVLSPEKNNHIIVPRLWRQFQRRKAEIKQPVNQNCYGICMPLAQNEKKSPDECYYMACVKLSAVDEIPSGMVSKVIPAGEYAVFTHKGALEKVDFTMSYIYGSWLPKSGKKLRMAADLEVYDHRFDPESDTSEFDIYIPVE